MGLELSSWRNLAHRTHPSLSTLSPKCANFCNSCWRICKNKSTNPRSICPCSIVIVSALTSLHGNSTKNGHCGRARMMHPLHHPLALFVTCSTDSMIPDDDVVRKIMQLRNRTFTPPAPPVQLLRFQPLLAPTNTPRLFHIPISPWQSKKHTPALSSPPSCPTTITAPPGWTGCCWKQRKTTADCYSPPLSRSPADG